jgi:hypothetical protein
MRLKDIDICLKDGKMGLDIPSDYGESPFCIIYGAGKARIVKLPVHGETKLITHQGKVKRVKFDEGEDF